MLPLQVDSQLDLDDDRYSMDETGCLPVKIAKHVEQSNEE